MPDAWEGVPIGKFLEALEAELESTVKCGRPYKPLNNSNLYKPHSKKTHRLSDAYWAGIDPRRFDLPVSTKAVEEEAFSFLHKFLLTDRNGCDHIVGAMLKLWENKSQLVEFANRTE